MPNYTFRCEVCGYERQYYHGFDMDTFAIGYHCPHNDGTMTRVITSPTIRRSMPAHYNPYVDTYVTNPTQYSDELKRQSEAMNIRGSAGEVDYQLADPDPEFFGVGKEGDDYVEKKRFDMKKDQGSG